MKGKTMPIREQNNGLAQNNQHARHLTPRTQQQMIAAARRQAQFEANAQDEEQNDDLEEDPRYYETRLPTSVRRYQHIPDVLTRQGNVKVVAHYHDQPLRAHRPLPRQKERFTDEVETPITTGEKQTWSIHPLLYLGVGMIAMLALVVLVFSGWNWIQIKKDDLTYGRPRTFQIDFVVGHNDSPVNPSHFTAINLNRHVEVIEWPGQDSSKMKVYQITTLFGDGGDLTPVTLSFADLTGNGKPDMLIHIQDTVIAMINDNGSFRPARPGEVKGLL
jgi:hypothetical protein